MFSNMYDTKDGTELTVVVNGRVAYCYDLEDILVTGKGRRFRSRHDWSALAIICKDRSTAPLEDGTTLYTAVLEWLSREMETTLVNLSRATAPRCIDRHEARRKRLATALRAWNFEPPVKEGN